MPYFQWLPVFLMLLGFSNVFAATSVLRLEKGQAPHEAVIEVKPRISYIEAKLGVEKIFPEETVLQLGQTGNNFLFQMGDLRIDPKTEEPRIHPRQVIKVPRTQQALLSFWSAHKCALHLQSKEMPPFHRSYFFAPTTINEELPALVMPYTNQGTLADRIHEYSQRNLRSPKAKGVIKKRHPFWTPFKAMKKMATLVDTLHIYGILHNDIKPSNFIFFNGHMKLGDFELSSFYGQPIPAETAEEVLGSPGFVSTRRLNGADPQMVDDAFSLVVTYRKLLMGSDFDDEVVYESPHSRNRLVDPMLSAIAWHQFHNVVEILEALDLAQVAYRGMAEHGDHAIDWFFNEFINRFVLDAKIANRDKPETLRRYDSARSFYKELEGSIELQDYLVRAGAMTEAEAAELKPDPPINVNDFDL